MKMLIRSLTLILLSFSCSRNVIGLGLQEGSGGIDIDDTEEKLSSQILNNNAASNDTEPDQEIFMIGNDQEDGSGILPQKIPPYVHCNAEMVCYCLDSNNQTIPTTAVVLKLPANCAAYRTTTAEPIATRPLLPPATKISLKKAKIPIADALPDVVETAKDGMQSPLLSTSSESIPATFNSLQLLSEVNTQPPTITTIQPPPTTTVVQPSSTSTVLPTSQVHALGKSTAVDGLVTVAPPTEISTQQHEKRIPTDADVTVGSVHEGKDKGINGDGSKDKQIGEAAEVNGESSSEQGLLAHEGIMAAVIGGCVVGALFVVLLVMYLVYRMKKKDEGSYPLDDGAPVRPYAYMKASDKEFYA